MKRPLFFAVLILILLLLSVSALAAPRSQEQRPIIAQPQQDAAVRGVVQLIGSATHPQFQRYELYYAPWPVPSDQSWIFIGDAHYQQQPLGLLGTWDSRSVPDGTYALRVRVVKQDGNYIDSNPLRVLVANTRPAETPTPEVTNTPTLTPTPLPPTATIVIVLPAAETPTPEATTQAESNTPILPTPGSGGTGQPTIGEILDVPRLLNVARQTAVYTLGLFAVVGLFFGIKALLFWLWQRIRP